MRSLDSGFVVRRVFCFFKFFVEGILEYVSFSWVEWFFFRFELFRVFVLILVFGKETNKVFKFRLVVEFG